MNAIQRIVNKALEWGTGIPTRPAVIEDSKSPVAARNLSTVISPVQLQRLRHDVQMWRQAIDEAEQAWYPHRVRMQRLYIDTILNGHVFSLMERRKDLSLLRDFKICDGRGEENEEWSEYFRDQEWFSLFLAYGLDALFFGYSLISLGDVKNDAFPDLSLVRRWNVSPDRLNVARYVYSLSGVQFLEEPWSDWHIWISTQSENGATNCGYGLFYKIGLYEILLRNTLGFNADFIELYGMPYRVGKTTKTTEDERAEMEQALQSMGSAGYAILDPQDEITFLETRLSGTGWESYSNLEGRCIKVVSKLILGHEDAASSTPGKLGAGGDKEDNPITMAMLGKQTKDGRFLENVVNKSLLPRMRNLGFNIPQELKFKFKNDEEKEAFRQREDKSNQATAGVFKTIKDAGGKPDWKYFTDRTGIPVEEMPEPVPVIGQTGKEEGKFNDRIQNKLNRLYGGK